MLLKLQIDARQRTAIFVRFGNDHAVNHFFIDFYVHVPGDDRRQFRVRTSDIANAGARALVLVVDAHVRHQHDSVHFTLNLLNDLLHRLHRIGKVQPFHPVGAFGELCGHRRIHANNADFHSLTFNDFIRRQVGFAALPQNIAGQCRALELVQ